MKLTLKEKKILAMICKNGMAPGKQGHGGCYLTMEELGRKTRLKESDCDLAVINLYKKGAVNFVDRLPIFVEDAGWTEFEKIEAVLMQKKTDQTLKKGVTHD